MSDFCTTRQAADTLGVSVRTIQLWVESGALDAWKTAGGHRRIVRASLDTLIAERERALNVSRQPEAHSSSTDSVAQAVIKSCILVVEDEPAIRRLYELRLKAWMKIWQQQGIDNVTFKIAENGFEGLVAIGQEQPAVLITDLHMPGMDGFRMLRSLISSPEARDMEIVVVSGLSQQEIDAHGGIPAGITLLGKPIPFEALHHLIAHAIPEISAVWPLGSETTK